VAIIGAVFIGLGGAAAGAALAAGGASAPGSGAALDGTFLTAMHAALLISGLLAGAGAVASLAGKLSREAEARSEAEHPT
jgi:hypothetical protein